VGVMAPDYRKAQSEAIRLLKKYHYERPPVDPEAIAEAEGVDVLYATFAGSMGDEVAGFYDVDSSKIYINRELAANRKTFTIAHELAHHILHQDYAKSESYTYMPRNNYYAAKPSVEKEADAFAANLLVPIFMLRKYEMFASDDELASMFAVSKEVIFHRRKFL
jgi:Zn-dependent peptidase ImmA (M78 family)